jgi:hypothetical protein
MVFFLLEDLQQLKSGIDEDMREATADPALSQKEQ